VIAKINQRTMTEETKATNVAIIQHKISLSLSEKKKKRNKREERM